MAKFFNLKQSESDPIIGCIQNGDRGINLVTKLGNIKTGTNFPHSIASINSSGTVAIVVLSNGNRYKYNLVKNSFTNI